MSDHEHAPDWSTSQPADGAPGIVDVWCTCGQSGSVRIDPSDIQWEGWEEGN
jgi:hypothetical protein